MLVHITDSLEDNGVIILKAALANNPPKSGRIIILLVSHWLSATNAINTWTIQSYENKHCSEFPLLFYVNGQQLFPK